MLLNHFPLRHVLTLTLVWTIFLVPITQNRTNCNVHGSKFAPGVGSYNLGAVMELPHEKCFRYILWKQCNTLWWTDCRIRCSLAPQILPMRFAVCGYCERHAPESHYQEDFMLLADTLHATLVTCSGHDEQEQAFQATGFIFSGHCSLFLSQRNKFP